LVGGGERRIMEKKWGKGKGPQMNLWFGKRDPAPLETPPKKGERRGKGVKEIKMNNQFGGLQGKKQVSVKKKGKETRVNKIFL